LQTYILIKRGEKVESRHTIHAAVVDEHCRLIAQVGNPDFTTYFRSSAKPFQTLALFRSQVIDYFDFSDKEIALITSSHNGQDFHIEGVRSILHRIGVNESDLLCGFHPPYFPAATETFYRKNRPPSPIYNNCSGKHAGMLAACQYHQYDKKTYLLPNHPHQLLIRNLLSELVEEPMDKQHIAIDGCGVPAFYLSLYQMAKMNVKFMISEALYAQRISNAIFNFPEYLAGTNRFDTDFVRVMQGKAITKVGAEAIQSFLFFEPKPLGIVVKCEDGQFRGVESAAVEILVQLHLITQNEANQLQKYWRPRLKNHAGTTVGQIIPDIEVKTLTCFTSTGQTIFY
jgi:L-asparaginase II